MNTFFAFRQPMSASASAEASFSCARRNSHRSAILIIMDAIFMASILLISLISLISLAVLSLHVFLLVLVALITLPVVLLVILPQLNTPKGRPFI